MDDKPEAIVPGGGTTPREQDRIERVAAELRTAIEALDDIGPAVSIFGTARAETDSWAYRSAQALGERLASAGVAVITGDDPGIMEAVNRGARTARGQAIGLSVTLPREQPGDHGPDIELAFRYFFTRKSMLIRHAMGFAIYPGGFGTIDELFELLTLMQTGKLARAPLLLVGDEYWSGLYNWLARHAVQGGYISAADLDFVEVVADEEIAAEILLERMPT